MYSNIFAAMKIRLFCFIVVVPVLAMGQTREFGVTEDTKMTISGTSTIHDWTSDVTEVSGSMLLEGKMLDRGTLKKGDRVEKVDIIVPVKSIVSPRGATMDKKTYEALKSEQHPNIHFALSDNKINNVAGDTFTVTAKGDLTIAGITNSITMDVEGRNNGNGTFWFKGSKELNMKDYGMDPPTAMFGQIVTGEKVTIDFEVTFAQR
jgi:hypothetical protein